MSPHSNGGDCLLVTPKPLSPNPLFSLDPLYHLTKLLGVGGLGPIDPGKHALLLLSERQ